MGVSRADRSGRTGITKKLEQVAEELMRRKVVYMLVSKGERKHSSEGIGFGRVAKEKKV